MVCGEAHVSEIEEWLAALGDLEGFDAGCDDFLLLVVVAIYGISNFQVDDPYFTTIGVDKGVWRQTSTASDTGTNASSHVAATFCCVPVLNRLARRVEVHIREHCIVSGVSDQVAQVAREAQRQAGCVACRDNFPVRMLPKNPCRRMARPDF